MKPTKILLLLAALCGLFMSINSGSAQVAVVWQKRDFPTGQWRAVASSADGTRLITVADSVPVQISNNSGATWTPTSLSATVLPGRTVASSADGTVLAVADLASGIFVSINSGATWTLRTPPRFYKSIACSTNGTKMVAVENAGSGGQIYTSSDSGTNWIARDSVRRWSDAASSANGTKLVAVAGEMISTADRIYTSVDSGTNWTAHGPTEQWISVASSADGTKLVAVDSIDSNSTDQTGFIYISTDSGTNWTALFPPAGPSLTWAGIVSSADGSRLTVMSRPEFYSPGLIYASTDSGGSWQLSYAPAGYWWAIASSADGKKLAAEAAGSTGIYTYAAPSTNQPTLNIATTGGSASLSWSFLSDGFILQQNTNIATTNWVNVTNIPEVVNQTILPQTNANNFYRLFRP